MSRFRSTLLLIAFLSAPCFVEAGVHGRVYLDANGNGSDSGVIAAIQRAIQLKT